MFVIIKTGGKQYKIQPGDIVKLELLDDEKGKKVTFNDVLACNHDGKDLIGSPFLKNVAVKGEILENKKGKKVIVSKKVTKIVEKKVAEKKKISQEKTSPKKGVKNGS